LEVGRWDFSNAGEQRVLIAEDGGFLQMWGVLPYLQTALELVILPFEISLESFELSQFNFEDVLIFYGCVHVIVLLPVSTFHAILEDPYLSRFVLQFLFEVRDA
jgi:hypothetical protein